MDQDTQELLEMKAAVLQAMAHPIRIAVLEALKDGEKCVCDIAEEVDAKRSNVSRHLAVMLNAGILAFRKDGLRVIYSIRTSCVLGVLSCVSNVLRGQGSRQAELLKGL